MANDKKQSFFKGAAILSASTIVVKFVSFFFSVPLTNIIGSAGMAPYNATYTIFAVFNAIATAGLPVAVAKMVSSAYASDNPRLANKTFSVAFRAFSILGLILSIIMFVFSDGFAKITGVADTSLSIKALAPTVFFCSVMSSIRGFFQGKSNMKPTAVSQIIEAAVKLAVGLSLAYYVHQQFGNPSLSAAASIVGVSISAGFGAFYLLLRKRKDKKSDLQRYGSSSNAESSSVILKNLLKIAVPITIGSCLLFVLDLVDTRIINECLQKFLSKNDANNLYGSWGPAARLFDLPGAVTIPIATSLIPAISAAFTNNDMKRVSRNASSAIRMTLIITVPCAVGFAIFGKDISKLVYFSKQANADIIGSILTILAVGIVFNGLLYTTNSLLQAMGHVTRPVINMAIGGVVRIICNFFLISQPQINIYGAAISACISYLITLILNLIFIYKLLPKTDNIFLSFLPVGLASAFMGAASWGAYKGLCMVISDKIALICAILVAFIIYFLFSILFGAIRRKELEMLPKGEKIANLLHVQGGRHFE